MNNEEVLKKIKDSITLSYDDPAIISTIYHVPDDNLWIYEDENFHYNGNLLFKLYIYMRKYPLLINDIENILSHKLIDINWQNKDGETLLIYAFDWFDDSLPSDIISILLKYKPDVNVRNNFGQNVLMCILNNDNYNDNIIVQNVKLLIEHGIDVNIKDIYNYIPLMILLINISISISAQIDETLKNKYLQVIKYLLSTDMDINIQCDPDHSAIHLLIQYITGYYEIKVDLILKIIKLLLKRGLDAHQHILNYIFSFKVKYPSSFLLKMVELCLKYDSHNVDIAHEDIINILKNNKQMGELIIKYYNIQLINRSLQSRCLIIAKINQGKKVDLNAIPRVIIDNLYDKGCIDWTMRYDLYRITQYSRLKDELRERKKLITLSKINNFC